MLSGPFSFCIEVCAGAVLVWGQCVLSCGAREDDKNMKKISSHRVGVDQGSRVLFSDYEDGGVMWTGTGPRSSVTKIKFSEKFRSVPAVTVSISMWDLDQKTNGRADVSAQDITTEGFSILFKTWGDTRVARIRADWMAIGELPNEDDWQL